MSGLLCVTGTRGAPGASTLAVASAYTAPVAERVVLVDADPDGGALSATLGIGSAPGLVSLAASARHGLVADELARHVQACSPRFDVLAAPVAPQRCVAALGRLAGCWSELVSSAPTVADLGRWRLNSPALALVDAATSVVLVVDPTVAGVAHARSALEDLQSRCPRVMVVARGGGRYPAAEVAAALGVERVWELRTDRVAAAHLGAVASGRWPRRSVLARDAGELHRAAAWTAEAVPT